MTDFDNRQISRDSLFILAELRVDGQNETHRVKVRNLSPGGMMAEANLRVVRGEKVAVNLRNAGWVEGSVAWVQENRFGVAFAEDIDPKAVRANAAATPLPDAMIVNRRWAAAPPPATATRKIL
ncbi:PilZ domain-containing protein [Novosphingobium flavum]|uniref:PilZ domain-containing protein n=1 Tax=Novosphingobium flavum TaxID=1778672 RepID=A0A7X1KLB8_9SPHN|nr:PilZ domain-containing protein [Novosphingobium flavum]MBC2665070.1 PilZ domain-containing protein [Novosphingobium flavum]